MKCISEIVLKSRGKAFVARCACKYGHSGDHRGSIDVPTVQGSSLFDVYEAFWDREGWSVSLLVKRSRGDVPVRRFSCEDMFEEGMLLDINCRDKADPWQYSEQEGFVVFQAFHQFCKESGLRWFEPGRGNANRKRKRVQRKN